MTSSLVALLPVAAFVPIVAMYRPRRARTPRPVATTTVRRLMTRWTTTQVRRQVDLALPDAIDLVVLAVRSGLLPAAALRVVHRHFHPALRAATAEVLSAVDQGRRFADALPALAHRLGPALHPLVDGFAAADRDGLPLAPVLERLAADARAHRRRQIDTLARQLPVRLAVPLVVCTLPAFVLLAVVPLLLAAFASLHR